MHRIRAAVLLVGYLGLLATNGVSAAPPTYQVLRVQAPTSHSAPPHRHSHPHQIDPHAPVYVSSPPAQPYAYGWFGVSPRRHWTRHFGYYRNYTQWSAK